MGWEEGEPRPQGDYYCGVGADNTGREVSEAHLDACLTAYKLTGTNAEVALDNGNISALVKASRPLMICG